MTVLAFLLLSGIETSRYAHMALFLKTAFSMDFTECFRLWSKERAMRAWCRLRVAKALV
jgi:hypothetical protein